MMKTLCGVAEVLSSIRNIQSAAVLLEKLSAMSNDQQILEQKFFMAISHIDKGNTRHSSPAIAHPTEGTHLGTVITLTSTPRYIYHDFSHIIRLTIKRKCNNPTYNNKSRRQFKA